MPEACKVEAERSEGETRGNNECEAFLILAISTIAVIYYWPIIDDNTASPLICCLVSSNQGVVLGWEDACPMITSYLYLPCVPLAIIIEEQQRPQIPALILCIDWEYVECSHWFYSE
jgi:hypothetical protein